MNDEEVNNHVKLIRAFVKPDDQTKVIIKNVGDSRYRVNLLKTIFPETSSIPISKLVHSFYLKIHNGEVFDETKK